MAQFAMHLITYLSSEHIHGAEMTLAHLFDYPGNSHTVPACFTSKGSLAQKGDNQSISQER